MGEDWNPPFSSRAGTAILQVPLAATQFGPADVKGGSDSPAGGQISLKNAADPNWIGNFLTDDDQHDLFLDFGGWELPGNTPRPISLSVICPESSISSHLSVTP